jgi:hypothetical protein
VRLVDTSCQLVFLHPVPSVGHVMRSSASRAQNIHALLFMLGCARCGCRKKRARTRYGELVFLHPNGSVDHVVRYGVSGAQTSTHYFSC